MRLFVAAYPSAAALADLDRFVGSLAIGRPTEPGRSVRLVAPERRHLTLAFLGDVSDERSPTAAAAVEAALASPRSAKVASPAARPAVQDPVTAPVLWLAGGGRFGRGRFTTMWAGVAGDVAAVGGLARQIRRALKRAGLPADPKPFRAHLTLARPGDRLSAADIAADLAALQRYEGPKWTLAEIALVRSHLGPHPRYEPLQTWRL